MDLTIVARHCSIPDSLHDHALRQITRLEKLAPRAPAVTVMFESDHHVRKAEARVTAVGGPPLLAHGEGPTFRAALDRCLDKVERRLRRHRDRRRRRRSPTSVAGARE